MSLVIEKSRKYKIDITLKEKWLDRKYIEKHFGKNSVANLVEENDKFCIFYVIIFEKVKE